MGITVYFAGKPRDRNANALAEEYVKRLRRWARCEMKEMDPRAEPDVKAGSLRIALDPSGRALDTPAFVALIRQAELDGRDLTFFVGGADGLPASWRERADLLVSLSPLTLPHELARVILVEQIYRALATLRGHPYPR